MSDAPIYKFVDDNTINIELEMKIPGSALLSSSPNIADVSLSPICVGINPELISLIFLVWCDNIEKFQNIDWGTTIAKPVQASSRLSNTPTSESKSAHHEAPIHKSPILAGANLPHQKSLQSSSIPDIMSPSTVRKGAESVNLNNREKQTKCFDFTLGASEINVILLKR